VADGLGSLPLRAQPALSRGLVSVSGRFDFDAAEWGRVFPDRFQHSCAGADSGGGGVPRAETRASIRGLSPPRSSLAPSDADQYCSLWRAAALGASDACRDLSSRNYDLLRDLLLALQRADLAAVCVHLLWGIFDRSRRDEARKQLGLEHFHFYSAPSSAAKCGFS
jgi:hypothetical protein